METPNIDGLEKKSESTTEKLEGIEKRLGISDNIKSASNNVRSMYFKIRAIERKGIPEKGAEAEYQKVLDKFDQLSDTAIQNQQEYLSATQDLIKQLGEIKTENGQSISETMMDGGICEMAEAVYDGVKRAGEKILDELKENLKMLVSPEEWLEISKALGNAIMHPVDFAQNIINFVCSEYSHIARDLSLMKQNTTKKGFAIEMGQFIPETCLPLVVSSIGQGKIGKLFKFLKLGIPEKIVESAEKVAKTKKIDILKMKFKFGEIGEKVQEYGSKLNGMKGSGLGSSMEDVAGGLKKYLKLGNRQIELFNKYADVEYLKSAEHMDKFCRDLMNLSEFIEKNADHIRGNKEIFEEYCMNLSRLRRNMREVINGGGLRDGKALYVQTYENYILPTSEKLKSLKINGKNEFIAIG